MAYVQLDGNNNIIGIFSGAQNPPIPPGYTIIDDTDPRIDTFIAGQLKPLYMPPTPRQWLERLSESTQAAITKAAVADATGSMLLWLLKAAGNPSIDVTSAETQQGVSALVAAGVITEDDQKTLLTP